MYSVPASLGTDSVRYPRHSTNLIDSFASKFKKPASVRKYILVMSHLVLYGGYKYRMVMYPYAVLYLANFRHQENEGRRTSCLPQTLSPIPIHLSTSGPCPLTLAHYYPTLTLTLTHPCPLPFILHLNVHFLNRFPPSLPSAFLLLSRLELKPKAHPPPLQICTPSGLSHFLSPLACYLVIYFGNIGNISPHR